MSGAPRRFFSAFAQEGDSRCAYPSASGAASPEAGTPPLVRVRPVERIMEVGVDRPIESDVRGELRLMTKRLASAQAEADLYQRRIDELLRILNEQAPPTTETPRLRSV